METTTEDRRSRGRPGAARAVTDTDLDVLRLLGASGSSTASLSDLRALLTGRADRLRDSLWSLEAGGLVEVLESPTCGLICVLTDRGRAQVGGLAAPAPPLG